MMAAAAVSIALKALPRSMLRRHAGPSVALPLAHWANLGHTAAILHRRARLDRASGARASGALLRRCIRVCFALQRTRGSDLQDLHKALSDIGSIRQQLAAGTMFRGF